MLEFVNDANGIYYPGFFSIWLNTTKSFPDYLLQDMEGTFLHEYIHYLQDFFTTYGLSNINKLLQNIRVLYHGYKKEEIIEIPFRNSNNFIQKTNDELFVIYFKQNEYKELSGDIIRIFESHRKVMPGMPLTEYEAILGSGEKIPLGTHCILEGLARLIQDNNYPLRRMVKMVPYDLVPAIAEYFLQKVELTSNKLIILCEISLFHYNSMEFYVNSLKEIRNRPNLVCLSDVDFFDYFTTEWVNVIGLDGKKRSLLQQYSHQADELIRTINDVFGSTLYNDLRCWLIGRIELGKKIRAKNSSVFLQFSDSMKGGGTFQKFLNDFGFPPTSNIKGETYIHIDFPDSTSHYFIAMRSVLEILQSAHRICRLRDSCIAANKWEVTEECSTHPWRKQLDSRELCPFCAVWKTLGLEGKLVVDNSDLNCM